MGKKIQRSNEVRRAEAVPEILTAAKEQFAAKGFVGASISAIATQSGVNPSLIYHYFRNKEALWRETKRFGLSAATSDFTKEKADEELRVFVSRVLTDRFRVYRQDPLLLKIITWEQLQGGEHSLAGFTTEWKLPWQNQLKSLIKAGKARSDLDTEMAAMYMISALRSVFTDIPMLYSEDLVARKQQQYLQFTIDAVCKAFAP